MLQRSKSKKRLYSLGYISVFKKRLFRQIFFSFMISLLLLIFLYALFTFPFHRDSLMEVIHSEAKTLANSIALICEDAIVTDDDNALIEHNMAVIAKNPKIYNIIIAKNDGTIIETEKKRWKVLEHLPTRLKVFEKKDEAYNIIYNPELKENVFHYSMPVVISGIDWGWIHIEFSLRQYHKSMQNMYAFLLSLVFGSIIIVLIVSYFLTRYIVAPLLELTEVAKAVSEGDLQARVSIYREDEIGDFAKDFNYMVTNLARSKNRLRRSHDKLEKRVEERTKALAQKSKELEELNKNLDQRVREETEKSRKSEQLLILQSRHAAMGEMIGNIAHQWRQPLNVLGLIMQNIYFNYKLGKVDEAFIEKSTEKGKMLIGSMSKTIDDFRDFFNPNKSKEHFSVSKTIQNTLSLVDATYKNNKISFETDLDDSLICNGYPNEFSHVVLNILTNAKDALVNKQLVDRIVRIRTYADADKAVIEIGDNAGGIRQSVMDKIFDPYFTTKEAGKGTGIGLYMSKMIIEQNMGGRLFVQNNAEGAVFTIELKRETLSYNFADFNSGKV